MSHHSSKMNSTGHLRGGEFSKRTLGFLRMVLNELLRILKEKKEEHGKRCLYLRAE